MIGLLLVVDQLLNQGIRVVVLGFRGLLEAALAHLPLVQVGAGQVRDDAALLDEGRVAHDLRAPQGLGL